MRMNKTNYDAKGISWCFNLTSHISMRFLLTFLVEHEKCYSGIRKKHTVKKSTSCSHKKSSETRKTKRDDKVPCHDCWICHASHSSMVEMQCRTDRMINPLNAIWWLVWVGRSTVCTRRAQPPGFSSPSSSRPRKCLLSTIWKIGVHLPPPRSDLHLRSVVLKKRDTRTDSQKKKSSRYQVI